MQRNLPVAEIEQKIIIIDTAIKIINKNIWPTRRCHGLTLAFGIAGWAVAGTLSYLDSQLPESIQYDNLVDQYENVHHDSDPTCEEQHRLPESSCLALAFDHDLQLTEFCRYLLADICQAAEALREKDHRMLVFLFMLAGGLLTLMGLIYTCGGVNRFDIALFNAEETAALKAAGELIQTNLDVHAVSINHIVEEDELTCETVLKKLQVERKQLSSQLPDQPSPWLGWLRRSPQNLLQHPDDYQAAPNP